MEQNKIIRNMPANDRPKRTKTPVIRLVDEYSKFTRGKYHGWNDTYDREYNGGNENSYMGYKRNKVGKNVYSN